MLQSLWKAVLDFLFPPHCPGCRCLVEKPGQWCSVCLARNLHPRRLPLSPVMAKLITGGAWAVGGYDGRLRRLLRRLKFQRDRAALPALQGLLAYAAEALPVKLWQGTVVVPVPLHEDRYRSRGFNQTELIFQKWSEAKGLCWSDALCRSRYTQPQYGLAAHQRRENVQGAFAVRAGSGSSIRGQQLLLVDDILTTGATLEACAQALHRAGAASITVLVLASGRR